MNREIITLEKYVPKHDYVICVDSDGCALDAMEVKHRKCHGPCLIREWGLEDRYDEMMDIWCEINLYSMTRGINRFYALIEMLKRIGRTEGIEVLEDWVNRAKSLSNASLSEELKTNPAPILKKAYRWSVALNEAIDRIPVEEKPPYENVKETLKAVRKFADIAIVSSSNLNAVLTEWDAHGILEFTDVVTTQEDGSKAACIRGILEKGVDREHVVMVGDAPGDRKAAETNGVLFFPILTGREADSWAELGKFAVKQLQDGTFRGAYQEMLIEKFIDNLSRK